MVMMMMLTIMTKMTNDDDGDHDHDLDHDDLRLSNMIGLFIFTFHRYIQLASIDFS